MLRGRSKIRFSTTKKENRFAILLFLFFFLFLVRRMRLELTRSCDHYPLKVACIPISPPALSKQRPSCFVPGTGLEPAHLAACAPETHASTNSAIRASCYQSVKKKQAPDLLRAMNETRTRDPDLGKVVLYQLSYHRNSRLLKNNFFSQKRLQRYDVLYT